MPKFFGFIMFGNRCFGKLYDCLALAYKVTVVLVSQLSLSFSELHILGLSLSLPWVEKAISRAEGQIIGGGRAERPR